VKLCDKCGDEEFDRENVVVHESAIDVVVFEVKRRIEQKGIDVTMSVEEYDNKYLVRLYTADLIITFLLNKQDLEHPHDVLVSIENIVKQTTKEINQ